MYALPITFYAADPLDQLEASFTDHAHTLREMPGLLSNAWIRNGDNLGGFHVFADRASAEASLSSDLAGSLRATDGFDDFEVRGFDVLEQLGALDRAQRSGSARRSLMARRHHLAQEDDEWIDITHHSDDA